jgi:hypothetical protein
MMPECNGCRDLDDARDEIRDLNTEIERAKNAVWDHTHNIDDAARDLLEVLDGSGQYIEKRRDLVRALAYLVRTVMGPQRRDQWEADALTAIDAEEIALEDGDALAGAEVAPREDTAATGLLAEGVA